MLHLHRSERADALIAPLAQVLAEPGGDPFAVDVVAVPTRGVERWVAQRLSHHLGTGDDGESGICANVAFPSPARLVGEALATVLGIEADDDPWQRDRLTWTLLDVLDDVADERRFGALGRHLGVGEPDGPRRGRRLQSAQHLAGLFSSYAAQRPAMVRAWAAGRDDDGSGSPVPDDLAWQPELWRRLRARVGSPSPAERLDDAVRLLTAEPGAVDLPSRLSVFGPTRLPEDQRQVLHALARHRDVHLWLPHPSPALWAEVEGARAVTPAGADAPLWHRREVPAVAAHPLLASMARDATELQLRLGALDGVASTHHPSAEPAPTLLGALQRRLRDDAPDAPPHALAADDRSVRVHACHGRARQVEVLREALLGLFADDPTLEPRDVVVMCPDIEAFAPLVAATFGLAPADEAEPDVHPGRSLRVRLADRSLRQTNPLLALVSRLLELADGRVTASDVVDLAGAEPVRRRFRFDDEDLDRIRQWAVDAGVRWGEDAARHERFGVPAPQGTWATALDRILLGAAMAEDHRFVATAMPLDDVDSTDVDLAGRLAELVDRLAAVLADLDGVHAPAHWFDALDRALHLLADVGPADTWQDVEARMVLDDARQGALAGGASAPGAGVTASDTSGAAALRLTDVRALLAHRLRGRPTRAGFRTGALTVCSLEPMRAVPHRVVALLGMDDGAFPRGTSQDGDDVLLRDSLVGERDRRGEDRQLFLDAITAAQESLVVLYSGADERTGATRPPAVPVGELLDALDAAAAPPDGGPVRRHVVVRHPLQTADERNFADGALGRTGPFSFDALHHRAAEAARGERSGRTAFLDAPLPPVAEDGATAGTVDLDDLVYALEHPVRAFLRQRLGVQLPGEVDELDDRLPLELDPLQRWAVGDRLLTAVLDGVELQQAVDAEWRRGLVPPGRLGTAVLKDVHAQVAPVADAAQRYLQPPAETIDVDVTLPSGRKLVGTVTGVRGELVVRCVFSKLAAKHRLRAWIQLLALAADGPGRPRGAVTIGRGKSSRPSAALSLLTAPEPEEARRLLDQLVALRDQALREPLPMPVATTCAYARTRAGGDGEVEALDSARKEWKDSFESQDAQHVLVWGEGATLADLQGEPSREEQQWWPEDGTRLGVLARRLWEPLLEQERTELA
ncbi:exodeoxyribonuclease V subunit gamma [Actinotalea ferrariae]|uniref:exodeoxyribonuclease V subunit gamma n=1 Tax=Actinotalea ferrariae TaxID=1386098 RepID=UPI001C8B245A|nr:exodeoxyribonuclease V subunit gamma [Actinotalea ferrariae]MBX9245520.1 exodeoxyribonuclease V subunit gamma [Actinotalea ferrariae]